MTLFHKITIIALLLCSCSDPVGIPDPSSTEQFGGDFVIDGSAFGFEVGENNNAAFPLYHEDSGNLVFTTEFKEKDCSSRCPNSFRFIIPSESPSLNFNIDEALETGYRAYEWETVKDSLIATVKNNSMGSFSKTEWALGNQSIPSSIKGQRHEEIRLPETGKIEVCLKNTLPNGGYMEQCQWWLEERIPPPQVELTIGIGAPLKIMADIITDTVGQELEIQWSTGSTGPTLVIEEDKVVKSRICCKVKVKDTRLESNLCFYVSEDISSFDLVSQFYLTEFNPIRPNPRIENAVVLEYIDENKQLYTTLPYRQPLTSFFQITSIENYYDESVQKDFKSIGLTFSAQLYQGKDYLQIEATDIKIPIAYPN